MSCINATHDRNTVDNTTIEHRDAIDIYDMRHKRQRTRRLHYLGESLMVMTLREIHRTSRTAVGGHHLKSGRIRFIRCVVEGHQLVRKTLVEDVGIEDATFLYQTFQ